MSNITAGSLQKYVQAIEEFKRFALDSLIDGMGAEFDNPLEYLSYAMETFRDMKEDEEAAKKEDPLKIF
jgi:hypothetical protein